MDYNLPERFELEYTGADNQKHRPVMIHRAPFGSLERFIAVLIEHCAGKFPLWLSPEPVAILPISDKFHAFAEEVQAKLMAKNIGVFLMIVLQRSGKKIRDTELRRTPYMLIVGERSGNKNCFSAQTRSWRSRCFGCRSVHCELDSRD